jgi:hypothetical protein
VSALRRYAPCSLGKGYPELYISLYDPLLAAFVFAVLPSKWLDRIELVLARVRRDHIYEELKAERTDARNARRYLETFDKLASLYSGTKNRSSIISMQFKGMAKVTENMMDSLTASETAVFRRGKSLASGWEYPDMQRKGAFQGTAISAPT